MQENIIMIKNELKNMLNKEVILSDFKERFNSFVQWRIEQYIINK